MNLDSIKNNTTWEDAATAINSNFSKTNLEVAKIASSSNKYKGFFTTEAALLVAQPYPRVGDNAYVGATYPGVVYVCNTTGVWTATATVPSPPAVNISEYYKKTETDTIIDNVEANMASLETDLNESISNVDALPIDLITQDIKDLTISNIGYVSSNGGVIANDANYRYTPLIPVQAGKIYNVVTYATAGYCLYGYYDVNYRNPVLIANSMQTGQITIPNVCNFIQISCRLSNVQNLSLKSTTLISLYENERSTLLVKSDVTGIIPKDTELVSQSIYDESLLNQGFIDSGGGVISDSSYRYTPYINIYEGTYTIKCSISGGASIVAYEIKDGIQRKSIALVRIDGKITVPSGYNYIRFCTNNTRYLSLRNDSAISLYLTKDEANIPMLTHADNIENLIHEKGTELIDIDIYNQTLLNQGWIDSAGAIQTDASYRYTPYIKVYLGVYQVYTVISGGASIIAYDSNYNVIGALKTGSIGDGMLAINGGIRYIRISTLNRKTLSLKAVESIFDYKKIQDYSLLKKDKLLIKDNLKNSFDYFKSIGWVRSGKYSHDGTIYNIPINVRRPTAISFRFRINEDINSVDSFSDLMKLTFTNGDFVRVDLMRAVNTLCDIAGGADQWVSYSQHGSVPKYNSGFRVVKNIASVETVVSTERRSLTRKKPIVGKDAFHIRYNGTLTADMDGTSVKITSTDLVIYNGAITIASYPLVLESPVKELTDRLKADMVVGGILENYTIETYGIKNRLQKELLKVNEIRIISSKYYGGLQSWGAYIPYAVDETWHTCELYMDNMIHQNPAYNGLYIPVCIISIDGVKTKIYPSSSLYGESILTINGGDANISLRDLEIQDGQVDGYERLDDPTVATFVSNYSKRIIGLMGHHVLKAEEGSDEVVNSGYAYDMSTDRLVAVKRAADKAGYTMITIKDLADYYDGKKDIPNKCFFWIFDDIEIDLWYNLNLRDIFINNGIIPSLALVTSGIYSDGSGRPGRTNVDVEQFYLQHTNAIKDMRSYGWCPHLHGYTHSQVDAFTHDEFVSFMEDAKSKGEEQGMFTDIYTYSYGPHSVNTAKYMEHAGIRLGVTTTNTYSGNATGRYCISRINASDRDNYPFVGLFRDWME